VLGDVVVAGVLVGLLMLVDGEVVVVGLVVVPVLVEGVVVVEVFCVSFNASVPGSASFQEFLFIVIASIKGFARSPRNAHSNAHVAREWAHARVKRCTTHGTRRRSARASSGAFASTVDAPCACAAACRAPELARATRVLG
jgi:hypothetical protein